MLVAWRNDSTTGYQTVSTSNLNVHLIIWKFLWLIDRFYNTFKFFPGYGFAFIHMLISHNLFFHLHLCMSSPRNLKNTIYIFSAWVCPFFSATLKFQDHNLLRNKSNCLNLQLIFWIFWGLFLIIFLCWNPVQPGIICYLTFASELGFFLQKVIGNLRCCLYSFDKDQPLQTEF